MNHVATMQDLAVMANTHLGEHSLPGEPEIPSTFEVVVEAYARNGFGSGREQMEERACEEVIALLPHKAEPPADLRAEVALFVDRSLEYLQAQYSNAMEVRSDQHMLAVLFSAHLGQAQVAAMSR